MSKGRDKPVVSGRAALAVVFLAGVAGCTASPRYPISAGQAPGDGGLVPWQPRYPISRRDAAQNARDAAAGDAIPAQDSGYTPPPPPATPRPAPPSPADDDAPRALPSSGVDSSDLPPPGATPHLMSETDTPEPPPGLVVASYVEPADGTGLASGLLFAAYHHHHHKAAAADADEHTPPAKHSRHHRLSKTSAAAKDETADAAAPHLRGKAGADNPYETTVRPGEKLGDVAKRLNTTRDALIQLNDLKHPRHVHAGTVLKAPYRYSYAVQKGDTLYTVARRFSQDPDAVAKLNGLKHAEALQPGQSIQLPPSVQDQGARRHAEAEAKPEAAPERMIQAALRRAELEDRRRARHGHRVETQIAEAAPSRHARRGESAAAEVAADAAATPYAATRRASAEPPATYNPPPPIVRPAVPTSSLAAAGSSAIGSSAGAGAAPRNPNGPMEQYDAGRGPPYGAGSTTSAGTAAIAPRTAPAPGAVATLNAPTYRSTYPAAGSAYTPSLGRARATAPDVAGGAVSPSEIADAGKGRFVWPLRGSVISAFGDHGAQHNDGLDIAAQPGDSVHAAAAGEVVYAGSSIPGFGNLVLVKHAGGWVTAYAHLNRIEVRMRDEVTQGQEIGQAGQTGAVDRPLLHFEVRYAPQPTDKARPVDPALVLPAG